MNYKKQLEKACREIQKMVEGKSFPVFIGFESTKESNIVGLANIYVASDKLDLPKSTTTVFELNHVEGIFFELREFMSYLHLFQTKVNHEGRTVAIDTLYEGFKLQGHAISKIFKLIDDICGHDEFKVIQI